MAKKQRQQNDPEYQEYEEYFADVQISNITDAQNELGESAVTFSITGTYADLNEETEETEETGEISGTTAQ